MVGLKTYWITFSAFILLAACVPQTKQTQCKANEAFNSSLRTCVPIVGGPGTFVTIDDYVPHFAVTKSKSDFSNVNFSISVSNPYNSTYSIRWERVFNGSPEAIAGSNDATSITIMPAFLGTTLGQIGTHLITAKILIGNTIVDSHSFELKINELPKPTIVTSLVSPQPNVFSYIFSPLDGAQNFGFRINNNSTLDITHGWKTSWSVTKNGAAYTRGGISLNETDFFSDITSSGFNDSYLSTVPFNPSLDGVGIYTIRAVVSNDTPGEVVDERTWYVTVKYPDVPKVTARDIYESSGLPAFSTVVNAYNGVGYDSSTSYNFIPNTVTVPAGAGTQADFCVTVADGDGTMPGGSGVRVDYYLDGITLVYSGLTTSMDNKICLGDSLTPGNILFTNPSADTAMAHTIVAKIFDEDSNVEYDSGDLNAGLGTYPVTWNVLVKPNNTAPTVAFTASGNLSNISCGAAAGNAKTCSLNQDTNFVVGIHATDEFYSTSSSVDSEQDKISYSMILYRNGSAISTCSKAFTDVANTNTAGTDFIGPDYLCAFTVPSYDASGPVNPTAFSYSVSITATDAGSPIAGSSSKTSSTITYNLSPITEVNTAPAIDPQGATVADTHFANAATPTTVIESSANAAHFITEGDTLNINVLVSDAERDHHQIKASLCTDMTCASSSLISLKNVTKTDSSLTTASTLSYAIPENIVPVTTAIGTNVPVYFLIEVTDSTHTLGTGLTTTAILNLNVRNRNPNPQFGGTPSPLTTDSLTAMVGYPLTIDPGTVTDSSLVSSENTIGYQWYVDADGNGSADNFSMITGADSRRITWTPSNAIATGTTVHLRLCVHDNTTVNALPVGAAIAATVMNASTNGPNCRGNWNVFVRPNANALNYAGTDLDPDVAVWQDTTVAGKRVVYTAFSDDTNIYVHKTVFNSSGFVYTAANPGFDVVSFPALLGGAPATGSIKDISITGTTDNLYIAYQAADSGTPNSPRIKVRRLDKSLSNGTKTDSTYPDTGKFGYSYSQNLPTTNSASVTIPAVVTGVPYSVTFTGLLVAATDQVTVNGVQFLATSPETGTTLCGGGGGCSTNGNATKLASLINSSSNRALQGLTAVAAGASVTIYGAVGGEYLDTNPTVSNYIVGKLGKIVNNGANWYLPFIDLSTSGTMNRIRILRGTLGATLEAGTVVSDSIVLAGVGAVNWFENELNNAGDLTIASITTGLRANLHTYSVAGALLASRSLFGANIVDNDTVRLSATKAGNPYYYVAAKVYATPTTFEWRIGRYDASLNVSVEDKFSNLSYNVATSTVLEDDDISDLSIQAVPDAINSTEARLLVTSSAGTANVDLYSVRFRADNKLSCDLCVQLNTGTQVLSTNHRIAATPIDTDMTIGTAGTTANENQKDVMFTIYTVDNDTPIMSILNSEVESIDSTTTDTNGTLGHRPPFFGAN